MNTSWNCPACTMLNVVSADACTICGAAKPQPVAAAEEVSDFASEAAAVATTEASEEKAASAATAPAEEQNAAPLQR